MKTSEKNCLPKHYESIDELPMTSWNRINETGDLSNLLFKKIKLSAKQKELLSETWDRLFDEYIKYFDWGESFKYLTKKRINVTCLMLKKFLTKDESLQTFIDIEELKISELENQITGGDIYKIHGIIQQKMGFHIPMATVTVREFYTYLKNLK